MVVASNGRGFDHKKAHRHRVPCATLATMTEGLFVSYRRSDTQSATGRLADHLRQNGFGREGDMFLDIDQDIPIGVDFRGVINKTLSGCDLVIVVIGSHWIDSADNDGGRRLDNPSDTHRLEVAAALNSDARVIPVLVEGASHPSQADLPEDLEVLAFLQSWILTERNYGKDVAALAARMLDARRQMETEEREAEGQAAADEAERVRVAEQAAADEAAAEQAERVRVAEQAAAERSWRTGFDINPRVAGLAPLIALVVGAIGIVLFNTDPHGDSVAGPVFMAIATVSVCFAICCVGVLSLHRPKPKRWTVVGAWWATLALVMIAAAALMLVVSVLADIEWWHRYPPIEVLAPIFFLASSVIPALLTLAIGVTRARILPWFGIAAVWFAFVLPIGFLSSLALLEGTGLTVSLNTVVALFLGAWAVLGIALLRTNTTQESNQQAAAAAPEEEVGDWWRGVWGNRED
jgi:hypothetical protein